MDRCLVVAYLSRVRLPPVCPHRAPETASLVAHPLPIVNEIAAAAQASPTVVVLGTMFAVGVTGTPLGAHGSGGGYAPAPTGEDSGAVPAVAAPLSVVAGSRRCLDEAPAPVPPR